MKLRTRLIMMWALAIATTLAVAYIGISNLGKVNEKTVTIEEVYLPSVQLILNADRDLYQVYVAALRLPESQPGSSDWNSCFKEITDNYQQVVDRVDGYAKLATTQRQRDVIAQHVAAREKWKEELDRYISLLEQRTPEGRQQADAVRRLMESRFEDAREPLNTLTEISLEMAEDAKKEISSVYKASRNTALVVAMLGMGILLVLTVILVMRITRPLGLALDCLGAIASGDFTRPVPERFLRMRDEIGMLVQAVDQMQASIKPLLAGLKANAQTLAGNAEALSATSEEIASSANEVANAIQQVASGAGEQANHLQEILNLLENMAASMERVDNELGKVKTSSEEASRLADVGKKELDMLIASIKGVRKAFSRVTEKLASLSGSVEQIGEILEVINGIADQTNLLALNAAIEAARAGDAGRGFAVVAEEVRKLAEQSRASSDKIKALLNTIGSETNEVVNTSEEVSEQVEAQLGNVEKTVSSFDDILGAVAAITPRIENAYSELDSTVKAKDVVLERVQNISAVSQETSASAEEISASAEELSASTQEIAANAQQVLDVAKKLEEQIGRFQV